jgi:hypothetical protein
MDLISFGCSFIYGSDLADDGRGLLNPTPNGGWTPVVSYSTWPALIARKLKYNYTSYALPGIGNLQIVEQVLNQLATKQQGLYVISWTWIDRFDYLTSKNNQWKTVRPSDNTTVAHNYYRDLHSQYRDKLTTLMGIKLIIDSLVQNNQPFVMTAMDELIFETEWHTTPAVLELQNYIRPYITTFEGQTFLNWSRKNGYPESAHWHPLESAHEAAANYLLDQSLLHSA